MLSLALSLAVSAASCTGLAKLAVADTTIAAAEMVSRGAFRPPAAGRAPSAEMFSAFDRLPPFCRVQAVVAPSPGSHIELEVWLPASDWNGRLLGAGNGGYGGSISYTRLGEAVDNGYAGVSTDTGHKAASSRDAQWATGHPERQADFDHRAVHAMTVVARAAIRAFYGRPPDHAYFNACSNGGRQGLMEAERYPGDYDGIMAGAPAIDLGFRTFPTGDLDAFRKRGGKLILYHGGNDAPRRSIDYYGRLPRAREFAQLYVVPGMGHCGSGDVPNDVGQWLRPGADSRHSLLKALERWVERGVAPQSVIATQYKRDGDVASGVLRERTIRPRPGH